MAKTKKKSTDKSWVVYLLCCRDMSFYTGLTNDMERRLVSHNKGIGAKYTRSRRPVKLITRSRRMTRKEAMKLEIRIKRLPREKKVAALTVEKKRRK